MKARCIALCEVHDVLSQWNSASSPALLVTTLALADQPLDRDLTAKSPQKSGAGNWGLERIPPGKTILSVGF